MFKIKASPYGISSLYVMKLMVIMALFITNIFPAAGQKYLQLEKNHLKTKLKYKAGDEIIFKLNQSDQWIRTAITAIDYENNILHTYGITVPVDSISAIKSYRPFISPVIGEALWKSGLAAFGTSALYGIFFQPPNTIDFLIATGSIALAGLGLKQMAKIKRVYEVGNKYNIRLTDLNFYMQGSQP